MSVSANINVWLNFPSVSTISRVFGTLRSETLGLLFNECPHCGGDTRVSVSEPEEGWSKRKKQPIWHFHLRQFVYLMTQMVITSNCSLIIHPVLHVFVSFSFLCSMYLSPEHICTQFGCYRQYCLYSNDGSQKEEVQSWGSRFGDFLCCADFNSSHWESLMPSHNRWRSWLSAL